MPSAADWLESLSPWPADGFGTERMRALLARLGEPQRRLDTVHVVGTKGKSTAARRIARTIGGPAYTSPHVAGWHERLDTDPAGFAARVVELFDQPEKAAELAARARAEVEGKWDMREITRKLEQSYREELKKKTDLGFRIWDLVHVI